MLWNTQKKLQIFSSRMHLNSRKNVTLSSNLKKYLSKEYASDKEKWGQFDAARWNAFYKWDKENGILKEDLTDKGFTNEFVKIMTEIRLEHVSYAYGDERF